MIEIGALKFRTLNIERLSVPNGITCIIGENGSGKSTLARLLCGYYEAKTGSVIADGVPVRSLDTGYVPEFFDNGIIFENVADEITSPLRFAFEDNATISDRLNAAAELLGIEDLLGKETENISGGEKACVALATAIISSPRILVLDEPDSHLDRKTSERIMAALKKLHTADAENKSRRTSGIPYIINCTQNTDIAADADFVIFMEDGRAVYSGTPTAVFEELKQQNSPFLPTPMRIDAALEKVANPADTATANTPSAATAANAANAATEKATPTANAATENCSGITPKLELKG
ncbi:MAG: ABC transporter ATP-binding protein, partial [Methanomicrobium sp.]|nr:ABC transporter ATP-binding protein [Methanomicrobium sp.]